MKKLDNEFNEPDLALIYDDEPLADKVIKSIQTGDHTSLRRMLSENPGLSKARIIERKSGGVSRTVLHVVTDWPGHFPGGAATMAVLVEFGSEVNARFIGQHSETPLHWASSCDDIEVLDALLDVGADIEAPGAVIAGGTPLDDAVAFGQWRAAHRLVERGSKLALWHAAALGLMDAKEVNFAGVELSERYPWGANCSLPPDKITIAFWCACHGGQLQAAQYLLDQGADLNWISVWDGLTPLDAAKRSSAADLVQWLYSQGAKSAKELESSM